MKNRQLWLWLWLALAVVCGIAWEAAPLEDASKRLARLPANGFGLKSQDLPLQPKEREILQHVNVVRREYQFKNHRFTLTAIDGTKDRQSVHDPFYCIRGSGWEIVNQSPIPLPGGEASLLHLRKDGVDAEAVIWFSDGRQRHSSARRYWWQTTLRRATLGLSSPEPVLVNLQSTSQQAINWRSVLHDFPGLFEL